MDASRIPAALGKSFDFLLSEWFQARCVCCGRRVQKEALCPECRDWSACPVSCPRCGEPTLSGDCPACDLSPPPWEALHSQWNFDGCARRYWLWIKYGTNLWGMGSALRGWNVPPSSGYRILAVPQSPEKTLRRGGDIVGTLARAVAKRSGLPLEKGLARRSSRDQARLGRKERLSNARGAYYWDARGPAPSRVLLVDDVFTTGATARACTEVLRRNGTREVRVWTLFRTPSRQVRADRTGCPYRF